MQQTSTSTGLEPTPQGRATPTTRYMSTSAGLIHWKDYGGVGNLVVLVHGLGGSLANWDAVGPALSAIGHTVALDLPGFGLSPPAWDWELETHVGAIRAFISQLGDPVTLIGNSMGGLLVEMIAAGHGEIVDDLVLVSPATPPRLPDARLHWPTARRLLIEAIPLIGPALMRRVVDHNTPEELVQISLDLVTHNPERIPPEMVDDYVELARVRKELPWSADSVPKTGNSIARHFIPPSQFVRMIRDITAPTLVVQGVDDHIVSPTSVEWVCSLRPDWELAQLTDTGHTPQIDAPERFLQVVVPWLGTRHEREFTA